MKVTFLFALSLSFTAMVNHVAAQTASNAPTATRVATTANTNQQTNNQGVSTDKPATQTVQPPATATATTTGKMGRGDLNGDGKLDAQEVKLLLSKRVCVQPQQFGTEHKLDANGDGRFNASEAKAGAARIAWNGGDDGKAEAEARIQAIKKQQQDAATEQGETEAGTVQPPPPTTPQNANQNTGYSYRDYLRLIRG